MANTKILLVEDNEDNRDMLSRRLQRKGYDIVIAVDGVQGVEAAQAERPDLILMDLSLPLMDGWEATRRIKKAPTTSRIPVIALTAHAMSGDREKALQAGCDDYDTKPVDLKRLLPKIEALLAAAQSTPAQPLEDNAPAVPPAPGQPPLTAELIPPTLQKTVTMPETEAAQAQRSLLLVDDNEMNRDMLSRRLVKQGYLVTTASDGQEALTFLENAGHGFDLILLDVMMPGISGIEVLTQLRQRYTSTELPIIMVTAKDQSEDVVKALELGANDYVTKPVDFPIALARIQTQISLLDQADRQRAKQQAAQPASDPSLLKGRYKLSKVLGSGGFGRTYIAKDTQRPGEPICVVKQLRPSQTDPKALAMARRLFNTEAETLERLRHEQIPQLLAYFEESQEFYLVQEYIEGSLLSDELEKKRFNEMQVLAMLWDLMNVLHYVHQQKVIHRDIKPQNIIRRQQNNKLVLIDFGAVKEITLSRSEGRDKTIGIGTRGFAPLEQYAGRPRYNSDIYAVGMVAVQALTSLVPDQLEEDYETGQFLWQKKTQVSAPIAAVIDKMICTDFTERYQSSAEVLQDLRRIAEAVRKRRATSGGLAGPGGASN